MDIELAKKYVWLDKDRNSIVRQIELIEGTKFSGKRRYAWSSGDVDAIYLIECVIALDPKLLNRFKNKMKKVVLTDLKAKLEKRNAEIKKLGLS